jgi:hypothetical protein
MHENPFVLRRQGSSGLEESRFEGVARDILELLRPDLESAYEILEAMRIASLASVVSQLRDQLSVYEWELESALSRFREESQGRGSDIEWRQVFLRCKDVHAD